MRSSRFFFEIITPDSNVHSSVSICFKRVVVNCCWWSFWPYELIKITAVGNSCSWTLSRKMSIWSEIDWTEKCWHQLNRKPYISMNRFNRIKRLFNQNKTSIQRLKQNIDSWMAYKVWNSINFVYVFILSFHSETILRLNKTWRRRKIEVERGHFKWLI